MEDYACRLLTDHYQYVNHSYHLQQASAQPSSVDIYKLTQVANYFIQN